ncbi:MAG: tRNA (guanine-N(1)-)-methyltransferase [Parcubacteria group bacterium GW2011_GWB1_57_6]|nr:MAG: tRNA (guanine-N(1)-)-methyltransferase [Parcubacteria group bacterium GW2011_GWA1_56_13]KKW45561.1 MAG: tRNA (guanine-N(1)-)-methyltransferase [Parcubacteria group bacterium GW2011_GWB1_57_6]
MMRFHLITLFEDECDAYLSASIVGRARKEKKISVAYQNPRDFVDNKWGKVDERPYGGGPGMVMSAMPVARAVQRALRIPTSPRGGMKKSRAVIIWFSPSAKQFTNKDADALAKYGDIALVCGRYEGIDERAKKILKTLAPVKEFAVGEAVYTGGEVPALAVVDAVTRRLPGVLGKDASVEERRIASRAVYTRPETIEYKKKKYQVPKVLQTGHHANINAWRQKR